ncbi:MAG: glycosyltransferase family 4 protein [Candidatus Moranbacteria bacterium]|nr:glycosyltransferase family 4 protein [Candidatus Moranbacteria bacterium]
MKLLIITQKVDKNDSILGFFHNWIEKISKKYAFITVICLEKGAYSLPKNVKILSLGKENKQSKFSYFVNFYKYIWQERKNYDSIFVHMNQIYILLGGFFWRLNSKRIALWRNHPKGNIITNIAVTMSDIVFCTSPLSYTARFKKTKLMPAGIDTEIFKRNPNIQKIENSILLLGRISPIKNVEVFIKSLGILKKKHVTFEANIIGGFIKNDEEYYNRMKLLTKKLHLEKNINWIKEVSNNETPAIYNKNDIFINLTPSGSLDKTILEAMACENTTIVSNSYFNDKLSSKFTFQENNPADLAQKIIQNMSDRTRSIEAKELRNYVILNHSLNKLIIDLNI